MRINHIFIYPVFFKHADAKEINSELEEERVRPVFQRLERIHERQHLLSDQQRKSARRQKGRGSLSFQRL